MNRTISYCGIAALLALFSVALGCKQAVDETPEPAADSVSTVNYSTAEPVKLIELTSMKEYEDFIKDADIAVVKFTATWCGPCQALEPELEKMAGYYETEGVKIAEVDVDKMERLANEKHISSIPHTIVFYHGNELQAISGADAPSIASLIDSVCQKAAATSDAAQANDDQWLDDAIAGSDADAAAAQNKAAQNKAAQNKAAQNKAAQNKAAQNKAAQNKAAEEAKPSNGEPAPKDEAEEEDEEDQPENVPIA